jgi:signal transduction histidine kinase
MIHELEEHQEQLVQSRKIAAVGTLTSGIAHELNNPINNIVLTAESLKEDFRDLAQEEAMGLIQDILTQSERASEIVKGLLDFSRVERPEFEALSIGTVVQDTLKLVRNAIQAMLDGGTLQISSHPSPDGQWMVIDVTDTGVGIDPEHLSQIFDPFYTTKQVGRGTGLGLSVTYGIVEKHGGHIEVKSSKGAGATFTLTLPLEQPA